MLQVLAASPWLAAVPCSPHPSLQAEQQARLRQESPHQLRLVGTAGLSLSSSSAGCAARSLQVLSYRFPALTGASDLADTLPFSLALFLGRAAVTYVVRSCRVSLQAACYKVFLDPRILLIQRPVGNLLFAAQHPGPFLFLIFNPSPF